MKSKSLIIYLKLLFLSHWRMLRYFNLLFFFFVLSSCDSSEEEKTITIPSVKEQSNIIESMIPKGYLAYYSSEQELTVSTLSKSKCSYQDVSLVVHGDTHNFSDNLASLHRTKILVFPNTEYTYKVTCSSFVDGIIYEDMKYGTFTTSVSETDIPTIIKAFRTKKNKISLLGYNFGLRPLTAPFIHDKFENGEDGQTISGDWTLYRKNNKGPFYTAEESYSGNISVKNKIGLGTGTGFNTAWQEFSPSQEIYLSYRFMFKLNEEVNEGVMKLARITSNYEGELSYIPNYNGPGDTAIQYQPQRKNDGWLYASYNIGNNVWQGTISSGNFIQNKWNRVEIYKKLSSPLNVNGKYLVKINNTLVINKNDVLTRGYGFDFQSTSVLLPLMFANPGLGSEIVMYVDDIYVDATISRVELANCPNYEECTIREIQEVDDWSLNKIDIILTHEKLLKYDDMYLFVIDANGAISEGFLIKH
jgi:hypothetical protein